MQKSKLFTACTVIAILFLASFFYLTLRDQFKQLQFVSNQISLSASSGNSGTVSVNTWNYMTSTDSKDRCQGALCASSVEVSPGRIVDSVFNGLGVGVEFNNTAAGMVEFLKDGFSTESVGGPTLRCFGDQSGNCNSLTYGPIAMPANINLPVLSSSVINTNKVTLQGVPAYTFKSYYVNPINVNSCVVSPAVGGKALHSVNLFLIDSYNFGGTLGVKQNVLVEEEISGYPVGSTNPWKGMRLERYYYVAGRSYVAAEGREDPACRVAANQSGCTGVYSSPEPGLALFNVSSGPKKPVFEYCAPGATGAKVVSQSIPATMIKNNQYSISITIQNTGGTVWTAAKNYKLGSQNPANNSTWGLSKVLLGANDSIAPGQSKTFTFTVKAPQTAGSYNMNWKMLQDGAGSFGDTASQAITVQASGSNSNPIGYFDTASCSVLAGWTCDPDSYSSSTRVVFYANHSISQGGTLVGNTIANVAREAPVGVACGGGTPNHGFNFTTPSQLRYGGLHYVYAYALDNETGIAKPLSASPKSLTCGSAAPAPVQVSPTAD